jgi:hypothetical protein
MDRQEKLRELERLRAEVDKLEEELAEQWPPPSFYPAYQVLAGFVLGIFGAATSLLFNIIGSLVVGQHPLQIIRVYLTFPLGETALATDNGLILAIGCCLYLATGMALGILFQILLNRYLSKDTLGRRFAAVSVLALALWLINFYAILSWLQPALFGDSWIIREIPWYVGALTHLIFGWTMLLVQPLGMFDPYRQHQEAA